MLWYLPWSESIKKRACRYLLQRYLGNFLEEKLTLDQLSVDIYNGTGTVCDVSLDCEALNELGDSQNWPLQIVDGYVQKIMVTIPWSTLLKDDSIVEVHGLSLTVQPKVRAEPASSMLESMWSSMSSSMQLAEECLREEDGPQDTHPVEGIEMFAHAIDSILSRVKVRFIDTKIRIEHVPKNSERGIALELHIKCINYYDEAGTEPTPDATDPEKTKTYIVSTYINKKIKFNDITLYTDEFPSKYRTMARSLIMEKSSSTQADKSEHSQIDPTDTNYQSTLSDVFYETRSVISTIDPDPIKAIIGETHTEPPTEPTPEEKASQPDPILFAKLTGMQELALKIKHTEEIEGPKIEFKMMFGSLFVFISPRQLHTMTELVNALNQPHLEDTSNIPLRPNSINTQCKPMQRADFQLIEAQLLGNLERENTKPNPAMYGWSGPSFDESDTESENFHPMTSPGNQMTESYSSSVSSMSTSMTSSVNIPSSQPRIKRNKKVPCIDGDPTAEVSHISLRISSVSCVLLHKDILISPLASDLVPPSAVMKMQETANDFFHRLQTFCIVDDFIQANTSIDNATERNHLRLIASDITLDGSDKSTAQGNQMHCEAAIKHFLVRECLYYSTENGVKSEGYDIIRFEMKDDDDSLSSRDSTTASRANIKVNFKQTSKYVRISGEKKLLNPTTDVVIKLTPVQCDVELTIMDRMAATFFGNIGISENTAPVSSNQNQFNLTVQCPCLSALLRFPVADLRPGINREIRRVRPDYLEFKFQNAIITSQQSPSVRPLPTTVTLKSTTLDLYYHENDTIPATHIARSTMDDGVERNILRGHVTATLPTISLTFQPKKQSSGPFDQLSDDAAFEPATNPMTTSMYIMNNLRTGHPSPFSGKKMAHQSVTKHEGSIRGQDEELIVPGTEEEMREFTNDSVDHSAIHLDFNLPVLSLQLESKQLYEILYNRINSDLLLWEPQTVDQFDISPQFATIYPAFGMCKGSGYDSDSGSSSSEEENLYYSTYDNKLKKGIGGTKTITETKDTHNFCLTLKIGQGLLTIYAPYRDSNKLVVPGHMGELVLEAQKLSMCQLSGLNGKPKTAQMCLRAGKTTMYHEAILTIPSERPPLRLFGSTLPSYLKPTIYPSSKGVQVKEKTIVKDMFSMALKAEPDSETPNLKTICITLGIEQATLRHRGDKGIAWLTQLMDVLDVLDYPVPGYTPSIVLSQLHVHVWACAVDYRPIYLPIRTVVTLNNFTVSSNIIPETNTSCLRFLAQECSLYLNHIVCNTKPNVPVPQNDDKMPDLNKDYVCVIDVGLFELSLRMEDKTKGSSSQPAVDVSICNNLVSLYTCWDSASALCRVLTYAAADGDCSIGDGDGEQLPDSLNTLIGFDDRPLEDIRELSPSEIQQVNDLMAEAMKESPNTTHEDELNSSTEREGVEIFFFPDESNMKQRQQTENPEFVSEDRPLECEELKPVIDYYLEEPMNAQVAKDLGDPNITPTGTPKKSKRKKARSGGEGSNTDDEFCIVETQSQSEDNDLEEPLVHWIGQGSVYMYDNHFTVPAARTDVLKAPKSFPTPVLRYTLCEMSVTWNMFGGTDFKTANDLTPAKKSVTIDVDSRRHSSPTTAKRSLDYEAYERERNVAAAYRTTGVRWSAGGESVTSRASRVAPQGKARGGAHRDHNVAVKLCLSKVKFQYEVYPTGGTHASRQTLAISKIEVLDRLQCSDINKLLSQYKLKDEPERNNAHMLIVKAVHLRPDPTLPAQECCLKVSLLPLRFNLDQDTLAFLVGFFSKLGSDETSDDDVKSVSGLSTDSSGSRQTTPTHRPPIMSIASHLKDPPPTPTSLGDADALSLNDTPLNMDSEPLMENYEAERLVSENLIQLEEDFQKLGVQQEKPVTKTTIDYDVQDDAPIYFRRVVFSPEVPIRLDYVGKRVDLSAGPIAGLLMGLGQLNCSELTLKRLDYKLGLLGLEKLVQWALHEWLTDVKRHQLPSLLSGIGPMHSLLQLITGIRDLVWLPVEQWRRDGRLVHGLRRGAASFTARTAVAALDITARLLHIIQATAETAFDMLTPGPTLQLQDAYERRQHRRRRRRDPSRQPADIREGVATAYQTVKEGFQDTATTMAIAARSSSGTAVLRHLPGCAVAPLALAAAGAADLLGGVRAHLAPHSHRDTADKWRQHGTTDTPN